MDGLVSCRLMDEWVNGMYKWMEGYVDDGKVGWGEGAMEGGRRDGGTVE